MQLSEEHMTGSSKLNVEEDGSVCRQAEAVHWNQLSLCSCQGRALWLPDSERKSRQASLDSPSSPSYFSQVHFLLAECNKGQSKVSKQSVGLLSTGHKLSMCQRLLKNGLIARTTCIILSLHFYVLAVMVCKYLVIKI